TARAERRAADGVPPPHPVTNGRTILEQADRMTRIIQQLLDFSRRRGTTMGLANLEQLVRRTLDLISPVAERANVRLECAASGPLFARLDQNQIQQVLANVFMYGIQAMPGGGRLRVDTGVRRVRPPTAGAAEADYLCVTVADEGRGLASDDLAQMCEAIAAGLGPRGFEIESHTSGEAALAALDTAEVDVVLTDLNMRGMDGLALCERVVASRPDVPVVVITAFGSLETAIAAIRAGAYDLITKPVKVAALAAGIAGA